MTQVGYIISVTSSPGNTTSWQTVRKIVGKHQTIMGSSTSDADRHLLVTSGGNKSGEEIRTQLLEVSDFHEVIVITWYEPVQSSALAEIRILFDSYKINVNDISDDLLLRFIDANLKGKYTYYLEPVFTSTQKRFDYLQIKPLVDHPQYSSDWVKENSSLNEDKLDEQTETETIVVELVEEVTPPDPPPPPPSNMGQMTDSEIRHWLRNNHNTNISDEDIQIIRKPSEVEIVISIDDVRERWTCPLKQSPM